MRIAELFVSDVTRDIPPVVYFHEQSPKKLQAEVAEYIITGGYPESHPAHRRVPNGIHEQYVRLLTELAAQLAKPGGPDLPAVWISGFYGSGKSCFAKLLGLALDGVALPDGTALAEAWLQRDTSPKAGELRAAWAVLRQRIEPLAVVFDVGGVAQDNEPIHAAAVRQVQRRLGYCPSQPLVADFELRLERDGHWPAFERAAAEILGVPWATAKDQALAEDHFSLVLSTLYPERYPEPTSWFMSRAGLPARADSPSEAVAAIRDMLRFRARDATLFIVVDEVSQYVLASKDRVDRLRAFASELGSVLRGRAWLLALGQQKLDEQADDSFLIWAKDRFPPRLRVHLDPTNIRDVVHRRLLQKRPEVEAQLRALFAQHRPELKLYGYGCDAVTPDEFVEVYPLLPGHIDLILQLTSALRTRSPRAQGDDQAIRGLLQLLGELFRAGQLAAKPVGTLVTLDQIYDVQHTALDSDTQASMARILGHCTAETDGLMVRAAKAVALLQLIQDTTPTDVRLVAQCLYDRVDRGNGVAEVEAALEALRARNLLAYSEKEGYKLQSSAGQEWEGERGDQRASPEKVAQCVAEGLKRLLAEPERPRLQGRPFPWAARFSDGRQALDQTLVDPRDDAAVWLDFRYLVREERAEAVWVRRSAEASLQDRLVWVCGARDTSDELARELTRSRHMLDKYRSRRESLSPARRLLLQQEENRAEDLEVRLRQALQAAFMAGRLYFRGRPLTPGDFGSTFATALPAVAASLLAQLFQHFTAVQVTPSELLQLLAPELSGPSPKFLRGELGILDVDGGRYVSTCAGVIPQRILSGLTGAGSLSGAALLAQFGGPPYGYTPNVVKACVAGLIRASRLRVQPESGSPIDALRDVGARDLFEKERDFRQAVFSPAAPDEIAFSDRARICKLFETALDHRMDREDHAIADAVALHFPQLGARLRGLLARWQRLPGPPPVPAVFARLQAALDAGLREVRRTKPTVQSVKRELDTLQDGLPLLRLFEAELSEAAIQQLRAAHERLQHEVRQLEAQGPLPTNVAAAVSSVRAQLARERPWGELGALGPALAEIRAAYVSERERLLRCQEQRAEAARGRVKARDGFATLAAAESNEVLRPLAQALSDTTAEAVDPPLAALQDPFETALQRAEEEANATLDALIEKRHRVTVVALRLHPPNRVIASEADLEALLGDIARRIREHLQRGEHVRLTG